MRCLGLVLFLIAGVAAGQIRRPPTLEAVGAPSVETNAGEALRNLAARAGIVFIGQVVVIERKGGVIQVRFNVQQSVQGAVGATYTLREWAGLWPGGQQRYAVGQRAVWFLNTPSAAGLSSPVDGMEGVVPLVPMGADAAPLVDLRRLATRVQREVGQPMTAEAMTLPEAMASLSTAKEPVLKTLPGGWKPMPIKVSGQRMAIGEFHAAR